MNNNVITKVVFTCTGTSYMEVLKASIDATKYTVTTNGTTITVTAKTADITEFVTNAITKQARINKIEVTYLG